MKRIIFLSFLSFFLSTQLAFSQKSKKEKVYRVKVYHVGKKEILKGYLFQVKDSSILLSLKNPPQGGSILEIPARRINKLKVRKVGTVAKTAATGALAGGVVGVLLSAETSGESSFKRTDPMWMLLNGVVLAIPGAILGPFFAAESKKVFLVKGEQELYKQFVQDLRSLSILK